MAEATSCVQCSTPLQRQSIGSVTGEEGVLRIAVADFPVLVCERGHRQFITRDFPRKLLEQLAGDKTGLPEGKKRGLLFKKLHCGQCDVLLEIEAASRSFACDVRPEEGAALHVELTLPVYTCPACKCEQLRERGEIEGLVPTALAQAFRGAGILPPR